MVKILPLIVVTVLGMILAEATTTSRDISQCNAASLLCCNTVLPASDPAMSVILALLGVVVVPTSIKCGLTCDPVNVIGAGGINCNANLVCCDNTSFLPLVAIGCVPVAVL